MEGGQRYLSLPPWYGDNSAASSADMAEAGEGFGPDGIDVNDMSLDQILAMSIMVQYTTYIPIELCILVYYAVHSLI